MANLLCVSLLAFATLLSGAAARPEPDLSLVPPLIRELHGDDNLRCLIAPDRVASFRVSRIGDSPRHIGGDYQIERQGPDLDPKQIDVLSRALIDMRGYTGLQSTERRTFLPPPKKGGWTFYGTGCAWVPGIVFAFHRGERVVNVVICFNCGEWAFEAEGKRYEIEGFTAGERASGLQPVLRWLAVSVFPDDEALKRIPMADWR